MSIKRFLLVVFIVLISLAIFLNVKYLNGLEVERKNQPIEDYNITEIWCHNSSKMSSNMTIGFRGKKYAVSLPSKRSTMLSNLSLVTSAREATKKTKNSGCLKK